MTTPGARGGSKTIQSVETALELLEALRRLGPVSLATLDAEFDHSKSTLHHHLATLQQAGYVERDGDAYRLGVGLLPLGGAARDCEDIYRLARGAVDRLARETGALARLSVPRDGHEVTLYQTTGEHVEEPWLDVGAATPLHCTAAGKAILATRRGDRLDATLEATSLTAYTDATVTDATDLRVELDTVRSNGVAVDRGERFEGVRCVGAAVTDEADELLGAVSVGGPADRLTDRRLETELPERLLTVVGVLEVSTTYADWADDA